MEQKSLSQRGSCLVEYAMLMLVIAITSIHAIGNYSSYIDCRTKKNANALYEAGGGTEGAEFLEC